LKERGKWVDPFYNYTFALLDIGFVALDMAITEKRGEIQIFEN